MIDLAIPERADEELLEAIRVHNVDYTWFSAKAKINYKSKEDSRKALCNIRIRKDSVIWLNVKKHSVEIARAQIFPDSVFIKYPTENTYEIGAIADFRNAYGFVTSFDSLQSLFVGNNPVPKAKEIQINLMNKTYQIDVKTDNMDSQYEVNPHSLLLQKITNTNENKNQVSVAFDKYKRIEKGKMYSHERIYEASNAQNEFAFAKIKLSSVEFNVKKSIKFVIPSHYIQIK